MGEHKRSKSTVSYSKTVRSSANGGKQRFNLFLIPLMFALFIIPLIAYVKITKTGLVNYPIGEIEEDYSDMYLYYKMIWFSIDAGIMFILGAFKVGLMAKDERISLLKKFWPLLVYALLVILSTIFSIDRSFSIRGEYTMMENVFTLLGYPTVAVYAYLFVKNKDDIKWVLIAAVSGFFVEGLICVLQAVGIDIYDWGFVQDLMMPAKLREHIRITYPTLQNAFSLSVEKGRVYGSLFNPNYIGPYVCMALPVVLSLILCKTKWIQKVILGVTSFSLLIMLFKSESKTGMFICMVLFVLMLLFLAKPIAKYWWGAIPAIVLFIVAVILFDRSQENFYSQKLINSLKLNKKEYLLKSVDTTGDCVAIDYDGHSIELRWKVKDGGIIDEALDNGEKCSITIMDENANSEILLSDGKTIKLHYSVYDRASSSVAIGVTFDCGTITFANYKGDYKVVATSSCLDESVSRKNFLYGYERMASGRGYIWEVTIPHLSRNILIGAGPDTFPIALHEGGFDYALKYSWGGSGQYFTRPHNYFLQMWIVTGGLSVLACLIFFIKYIVDGFKLYFFKKPNGFYFWLGWGLLGAVLGFLGSGLTNDSLIVVSPIFWTFLGLGNVVNRIQKDLYKNEKK